MGFKDWLIQKIATAMFERPGRKAGDSALLEQLRSAGETIASQTATVADTPKNRALLGHVIGVEQWGQQRLKALLGTPLPNDDSNDYVPSPELDMAALRKLFADTRSETVALGEQVAGQPAAAMVVHAQFGPLSRFAWLQYLRSHASRESGRMR